MTWYDDAALTGVITTGGSILPDNTIGTMVYYVTETENGCEGPASMVTITIENCNYVIPTAFTPNADGVHDDWEIYGLDVTYPNNMVRIYNRWGEVIWETYDTKGFWDGYYNGVKVQPGTYNWKAWYKDKDTDGKTIKTGMIHVIR